MHQNPLLRVAARTLRIGIMAKYPPGERRDCLLAFVKTLTERSPAVRPNDTQNLEADRLFARRSDD